MAPQAQKKDTPADPLAVLKEGIKQVPAVRYASGVLGIAAAASLIRGYFSSMRIGIYATLAVLALMVLLWIFAQLARLSDKLLRYPAMLMAWSLFSVVACVPVLLVLSVFFDKPKAFADLRDVFETKAVRNYHEPLTPALPAKINEPARFAGTITDSATGKGLEGVEVRLTPGGPVMAKSDSGGVYNFTMPAAPPDSVTLIYQANGHKTRTETVYASADLNYPLDPLR